VSKVSEAVGGHVRVLADTNMLPLLGLGLWRVPDGPECANAVRWALDFGYRHIDTAQIYGNERSVGQALKASGVPRDEVFITTKFDPMRKDPVAEAKGSLKRLGVEYVDLYLLHWPHQAPPGVWKQMERARDWGYARSIGVANFSLRELEHVLMLGTIAPVVDLVQFSPFEYRRALLDAAKMRNVVVEASNTFGSGRYLLDTTVQRVAERAGHTPAQVLLRWCVQHGLAVVAKSMHPERIKENAQIFDFALSEADMAELDALDKTGGSSEAIEQKWW
jgi:diketogulonate reductase-like aldo/keto reductase